MSIEPYGMMHALLVPTDTLDMTRRTMDLLLNNGFRWVNPVYLSVVTYDNIAFGYKATAPELGIPWWYGLTC